jgi:hypothetical protein
MIWKPDENLMIHMSVLSTILHKICLFMHE